MRVIGFVGWSGCGKTTLITGILPRLIARGLTVSTVKHAHHAFDLDAPGKDSWRHRNSGATEVLITSDRRWALLHELRGAAAPSIHDMLRKLTPVDLVLIEGFKSAQHARLEVYRSAVGKLPLHPQDAGIAGIVSDVPFPHAGRPVAGINDLAAVVELVLVTAEPLDAVLRGAESAPEGRGIFGPKRA